MWIQETLPVDIVNEAVFRALNWFLPMYFNIRREKVQQTVIYKISNKRGKMRGQYWIFPGSSGNAIHRMYWFSKNLVARKGFLMVIDDEIRKLLRQRIDFSSLKSHEVFQVNLYLAVDGQYGKDLPLDIIGESLESDKELIRNVITKLKNSGLVELTKEDHICLTSEGVEGTRVLIDENMANLLSKETFDESIEKVDDVPKWFPKSEDRREMWRDAYRFMEEMKREYYSDDEFYDKPEPSDEEYADRLAARMKWKPKPRTIRNVKRAGKIGLFE